MLGWFKLRERLAAQSHTAAPEVTSLLLPEVVGTAMNGRPLWEILQCIRNQLGLGKWRDLVKQRHPMGADAVYHLL